METEILLKRLREMLTSAMRCEKHAEIDGVAGLFHEDIEALEEAIRRIEAA